MILDPCLPALHHTAATLRAWAVWGRARPWWHAPVRAVSGPCSRAAVLTLPLLAGPATGPLPGYAGSDAGSLPGYAGSVAAIVPGYAGSTDRFGAGAYGPGGYGYAPGGFGSGGYGYAGRPEASLEGLVVTVALVPGGLPAVGTAYEVPAMLGVPQRATPALLVGAGPAGSLPVPAEGGASPPTGERPVPTSDTPQPVPEASGLAVVAVALLGVAVGRRRG